MRTRAAAAAAAAGSDDDDVAAATTVVSTDGSAGALRRQHRIHAKGADVPDPLESFAALTATSPLAPAIAKRVAEMSVPHLHASDGPRRLITPQNLAARFPTPTPIQMQAVPVMLAKRDLFGVAPTGSGKTLAYVLPILAQLHRPMAHGFRACIVAPTRELAQQIKRVCDLLCEVRRGGGLG